MYIYVYHRIGRFFELQLSLGAFFPEIVTCLDMSVTKRQGRTGAYFVGLIYGTLGGFDPNPTRRVLGVWTSYLVV